MIHEHADRSTLALVRVWIFGIWFVELLLDPIEHLSVLPHDLFRPPGFLHIVPNGVWSHVLEERSLLAFRVTLLGLLFLVGVGAFRRPYVPVATAALLAVYQGIVRGYSGHMNHGELALLWATMIIVFFPMSDVLSVRRPRPQSDRVDATARAAVLALTILFAATYFFVAAARFWKGIDLFGTDSLRNNLAKGWVTTGSLDGGTYRLPTGSAVFMVVPAWLLRVLYLGATVLELVVPLVLISKWARHVVPIGLLIFHTVNIVWLRIAFIEDMLMLVLFSNIWFPALGRRLTDLEKRLRSPVAVSHPEQVPLTT